MGSYLLYHRKISGLTQRELAELLGSIGPRQVAKLESQMAAPSFLVAVGYHKVFGATIAELFPGFVETVGTNIEQRISEMERRLHESTAKGREAARIARKLEWCEQRRSQDTSLPDYEE
jgi:transcriptional regulator with XRE-family HTH domain